MRRPRVTPVFDDVILDAPIALPAFGGVVAGDRIGAAVAFGDQHVGSGTEFDERVPHRVGASLGQRDIEGFVAGVVGVAGDLDDVASGQLLEVVGGLLQEFPRRSGDIGAVGGEIDRRVVERGHEVFRDEARLEGRELCLRLVVGVEVGVVIDARLLFLAGGGRAEAVSFPAVWLGDAAAGCAGAGVEAGAASLAGGAGAGEGAAAASLSLTGAEAGAPSEDAASFWL